MSNPNSGGGGSNPNSGGGGGGGNNGVHNQHSPDRGAAARGVLPWGGPSFSNVAPPTRGGILKKIILNGSNTNPSPNYTHPNN
ncbi:hypothetical protein Sjap_018399 [Stephania japonica]|uniref:Uncharacterized protein n=1 Tax=Stephania japonica TaxID=461633 RepID=A0AAP0I7X8_9MAGN